MEWLRRWFAGRPVRQTTALSLTIRCTQCGRIVSARVNLLHDLSELDHEQGEACYFVRKTLVDDRCFRRITAELRFSRTRRLTACDVAGGELLAAEME